MSGARCEEFRASAAELALSVLDGEDRARALEHARGCAACGAHLAELGIVAQSALLAAPDREPPPGFETRVLAALPGARRRAARRLLPRRPRSAARVRRLVPAFAAAILLGAAAATWITLATTSDERRVGSYYEEVLARAGGRYFTAAQLLDPAGQKHGVVFAYQGHQQSWITVVLPDEESPQRVAVTTRDGGTRDVGRFDPETAGRVWGHEIPVPVHDVESVLLTGADGSMLVGRFRRS